MNKAQQQFIDDYTIVMDNDFGAYSEIMEYVGITSGSANQRELVADYLQNWFENSMGELADSVEKTYPTTALLIRQMMFNWGVDVWDEIAEHYIDKHEDEVA